jgi:hypothetical protein
VQPCAAVGLRYGCYLPYILIWVFFGLWCKIELAIVCIFWITVQLVYGPHVDLFIFFYCGSLLSEVIRGLWVLSACASSCNVLCSGTCAQCVVGWMYNVSGQCSWLLVVSGHCVLAVRFCSVICCWLMAIWMNVVHSLVLFWLFFF